MKPITPTEINKSDWDVVADYRLMLPVADEQMQIAAILQGVDPPCLNAVSGPLDRGWPDYSFFFLSTSAP
jgi:hypothetical protein